MAGKLELASGMGSALRSEKDAGLTLLLPFMTVGLDALCIKSIK